MPRWLRSLLSRMLPRKNPVHQPTSRLWTRPRLDVPRYAGAGEVPPMHWRSCHPATVRRFKAEFSCPNGHGIVLKGHSIDADGTVHPSVVCPSRSCGFHDFVRLARWDAGPV
ncbi:UNVERIFIED_ORG: hypothetical protein M2193_004614 [Bradyrhizobium japonicum]|uniref:hypothetical protein n=1 Tax=Bradyrhizobium diazoefficiens TaxID=1355477 RepID=UPI003498F2DA